MYATEIKLFMINQLPVYLCACVFNGDLPFLGGLSDFTFRHNIPECSAHTLFPTNFVHISRMLAYNEYHEINRTSLSYFFEM